MRGAEIRWLRLALSLVVLALGAGCGGGQSESAGAATQPAQSAQAAAVAEQTPPDTTPALHRFLPDEMKRSTRAESFPHQAHVRIDCSVCHDVPRGHGTHTTVQCAACHRASAQATERNLTVTDCQTCHHVTQQTWTCEHCHGTPGTFVTQQQFDLSVWSAPRTRTLTFQHAWHEGVDCGSCHNSKPSLSPEPCSSCHAQHHAQSVRCQSCHTPSPIGEHDVNAHLSCSGSGCHTAPLVEAISDTRAFCLVCHQAQENHEAGRRCVDCHAVRPELPAGRSS
jgi:Class III cytochrome C family